MRIIEKHYNTMCGAEGRTRTGTALRHRPLKTACLPIPPLRQFIIYYQPEQELCLPARLAVEGQSVDLFFDTGLLP